MVRLAGVLLTLIQCVTKIAAYVMSFAKTVISNDSIPTHVLGARVKIINTIKITLKTNKLIEETILQLELFPCGAVIR